MVLLNPNLIYGCCEWCLILIFCLWCGLDVNLLTKWNVLLIIDKDVSCMSVVGVVRSEDWLFMKMLTNNLSS